MKSMKVYMILGSMLLSSCTTAIPDAEISDKEKVEIEEESQVEEQVKVQEDSQKNEALDVPLIEQMPELARGCEVTSLAMILSYYGIDVDKMELAKKITYEPFEENGLRGNINQGFVGNMETFEESGRGVYVNPILKLATQYVEENKIINLTGNSKDNLYKAIDEGSPVWILTNSYFSYLPDDEFITWQTAEGPMEVTYRQHSVVLTNYDEDYVYVNDPLQGEKNMKIDRVNFEEAWIQLGRQHFILLNKQIARSIRKITLCFLIEWVFFNLSSRRKERVIKIKVITLLSIK